MDNQTQIIYSPDYRSPPSGLGTISIGEDLILIQDNEVCADVHDGFYNKIIAIAFGYSGFVPHILDAWPLNQYFSTFNCMMIP